MLKSCLHSAMALRAWSRPKNRLVQELIAHPAVEALDVAILHGLSGRDVVPLDAMILRPCEDRVRGELPCRGQRRSCPACRVGEIRSVSSRATRRPEIDVSGIAAAFARHVIDDVEHTEAPPAGELIVHEVQRPARVRPCLDRDRRPRPPRVAAPGACAPSGLLAVEPVDRAHVAGRHPVVFLFIVTPVHAGGSEAGKDSERGFEDRIETLLSLVDVGRAHADAS